MHDAQLVAQLYANVLHRAPDAGGTTYWTQNLASGMSRAEMLVGISESPENQAALVVILSAGVEFTPT